MKKHLSRNAFTLVELLVVITIIGILAGIALPVFQKVQINANQTKDLANAKQIGLGLKLFANDYNGIYPTIINQAAGGAAPIVTANDALANLVPNYVPAEKTFWLAKSAFCAATPPDEKLGTADTLKIAENNFAYVTGLNDTSNGSYPLIADGLATVATGLYTNVTTARGGVWTGQKAIVIRVDQSGAVEVCNSTFAVFGPTGTGTNANIFLPVAGAWLSGSTVINPS